MKKNRKKVRGGKTRRVDVELAAFCDALSKEVESFQVIKIGREKIGSGSRTLLVIDLENLDEHVAVQPAMFTFWNAKEAQVEAVVRDLTETFDRWEREHYRKAYHVLIKSLQKKGKVVDRPTTQDVRSEMEYLYGDEMEKKRAEIRKWTKHYDTVKSFSEGVRQKGFALQKYGKISETFGESI